MGKVEYVIYELPHKELPDPENPNTVIPDTGRPDPENPTQLSTNRLSTKESKKRDKKESRHLYGIYGNVLLSDMELGKLQQEFPTDYQVRIERLSEYIASSGRSYKNHLATIRSWARRERQGYSAVNYTCKEGESL